jgi:D-alanine-D-alanine ligase
MAEPLLAGREITVGLLDGEALGVVEILAPGGVYDYASKYTPGGSEHIAPADLPPALAASLGRAAEAAFAACGCRDFARVDLVLSPDGRFSILEINTLPGMTETSLLPDSARCRGIDYAQLAARMAAPALRRAQEGARP